MKYRVTGIGTSPLEYYEPDLANAAYTASKMADQGVSDVHVFDPDGRELSGEELANAPPLPGWFKRDA